MNTRALSTQFSKQKIKTAFSRAARTYDAAAVLQKEILARLIEKLKVLHPEEVNNLLDVGSGTGLASQPLTSMFGKESYFACDVSQAMLMFAKQQYEQINHRPVCADVEALPYAGDFFDIVFSASTYQWCNDIEKAFIGNYQILKQDGLFIFSTFGPGTLKELRECFAKVDNQAHVSSFHDMQSLGDGLLATGYSDVVIESEVITVEYSKPLLLLNDLRATGATNHLEGRARHLMGKSRIKSMLQEYEKLVLANQKYPASYEVIYGHGWKRSGLQPNQGSASDWQPIRFS